MDWFWTLLPIIKPLPGIDTIAGSHPFGLEYGVLNWVALVIFLVCSWWGSYGTKHYLRKLDRGEETELEARLMAGLCTVFFVISVWTILFGASSVVLVLFYISFGTGLLYVLIGLWAVLKFTGRLVDNSILRWLRSLARIMNYAFGGKEP